VTPKRRLSGRGGCSAVPASARTRIAVLGAGNLGTALAQALAGNGHEVAIWDFFPDVVEDMRKRRKNRRFLPGIRLHPGICAMESAAECVSGASLVIISVPSPFVRSTLVQALPTLGTGAVLLNVAKGFSPGTRQSMLSLFGRLAPGQACAHLAGPCIANEIAGGLPTAIVIASTDLLAAERVATWFSGRIFLPSTTTDVMGAILGGILKNVYAVLLGCLEGLSGPSRNLEASILTASMHEMATIAVAHGGKAETLHGLAGLGDLIATGSSPDSHNRKLGQRLASGMSVVEIEKDLGWLPEGARAATTACALARAGGVRAPLAGWVRRVLAGAPPSLDGLSRVLRAATQGARG